MDELLVLARPLRGTVGETRRVCHVFALPRGGKPKRLAALCGAAFGPGQLELLDRPAGMPCVACLRNAPRPRLLDNEEASA
ncbi:hypothetical protein [Saccharomonospora azurea]|uniref:hypothetical protein n=1 Tax=Saccharomonospora azurea TaxID=40988 RepID=UPI000255FBD2|nr:hypothetical protein [Saccharomonospora azurea]